MSTLTPQDIRRLSVQQYHAMIESGILSEDDPVELLQGWLVNKMPKNLHHRLVTQLTREVLAAMVPVGWFVDAQEPITTADSEPEPDVVVVRGERRQYTDRHPGPDDIALIVEVADSSLQRDRSAKKRLYAAGGITEYWIINLLDRQLEQYTDPQPNMTPPDYQQQRVYRQDDELILTLTGQKRRFKVRDVLP